MKEKQSLSDLMKGIVFIPLVLFMMLLLGCESSPKKDLHESVSQMNRGGVNFPSPKFDKNLEELLDEYKKKYGAKAVKIGSPFMYSSKEDFSYWLKVELLNPKLENKTFNDFAKEVALNTLEHLSNDKDFERIEISVAQKKGFIITFSTSQNAFFYRDSLQVMPYQ